MAGASWSFEGAGLKRRDFRARGRGLSSLKGPELGRTTYQILQGEGLGGQEAGPPLCHGCVH